MTSRRNESGLLSRKKTWPRNCPKIVIIIVTYGDRAGYVVKTVTRVLSMLKSSQVIIVDNNSTSNSRGKLEQVSSRYRGRVIVIANEVNEGPGRAIGKAIAAAKRNKCSHFFWILDDDNLPKKSALAELMVVWEEVILREKQKNLIVTSFRKDRPNYLRAVQTGRPDAIVGIPNVFRSFHVKSVVSSLISRLLPVKNSALNHEIKYGDIPVAPYGGMFFHKDLVEKNGVPDAEYYLYFDDYEFSRRVVSNGGRIVLAVKSIVEDQERSWYHNGIGFVRVATQRNNAILYYSVRNRIIFERRYLVNNSGIYLMNALIYCSAVLVTALVTAHLRNICVFMKAVFDGFKGKKGIRNEYRLN